MNDFSEFSIPESCAMTTACKYVLVFSAYTTGVGRTVSGSKVPALRPVAFSSQELSAGKVQIKNAVPWSNKMRCISIVGLFKAALDAALAEKAAASKARANGLLSRTEWRAIRRKLCQIKRLMSLLTASSKSKSKSTGPAHQKDSVESLIANLVFAVFNPFTSLVKSISAGEFSTINSKEVTNGKQ